MDISLNELRQQMRLCTNCSLWETRTQVITGQGTLGAKLMLLGEAPGGHEDLVSGQAFTGEAGHQLEEFLQFINLERNQIYLTNTVKCRPTRPSDRGRYGPYANRRPKVSEIKACSYWLDQELKLLSPQLVITLGTVPLSRILGENTSLKERHGVPFFSEPYRTWIFPLFHPAAVIYNQKLKPLYWAEMNRLRDFLQSQL